MYQPLVARKAYGVALAGRILTIGVDIANMFWQANSTWYFSGTYGVVMAAAGLGMLASLVESYTLLEPHPTFKAQYGKVAAFFTIETLALGFYISGTIASRIVFLQGLGAIANGPFDPFDYSGQMALYFEIAAIVMHLAIWIWNLTSLIRHRRTRTHTKNYTERTAYPIIHAESQTELVAKDISFPISPAHPAQHVPLPPSPPSPTKSACAAELPPTDIPPPYPSELPPNGSPSRRTELPARSAGY